MTRSGDQQRRGALARRTRAFAALSLALALGCRSEEEWKEAADDEAYGLVIERLAEVDPATVDFTIEPAPDSLRERLLRGELPSVDGLGLTELLAIAAENSRDYQERKERLYRAALAVSLERWRLSWRPTVGASGSISGDLDHSEQVLLRPEATFEKVFESGAEVLVGLGWQLSRSLLPGSDGWSSSVDLLDFTQPILRGFGRRIVLEPLTQVERDLVYETRAFERFRRGFAIDVAEQLYRLLQQYDTVANEERNRDNLTRLRERNEALSEAGRLSEIEVDQARQDELQARERVISATTRLGSLLDQLKLFLGLPIGVEIAPDQGELDELVRQGLPEIALDEAASVDVALATRLDHMNALDQVDDAGRKVYVAADALRVGLDLNGSLDIDSDDGQPLDFDIDDLQWSVGAVLDLPVDRLPERNVYRATLIDQQAALRSAELSGDTIAVDVREDWRALAEARESYAIQQNAVRLATRRIESTKLNLEAGRATTRDLLEAQEDLVEAENATTQALIDFTLARLFLFHDLELVRVDERGLMVAEPPALPVEGQAALQDPQNSVEEASGPSAGGPGGPGW